MTSDLSIKILGLGLDARFRSMLLVFFERRRSTHYQFVDDHPDIVIADLDAVGVRDLLASFRKENTSKPTILFSLDESEYHTRGDLVVLRKPFTVKQLISAFDIMELWFRVGRQRLTSLSKRKQDSPNQEVGKQGALKQETLKQEPGKQEPGKQEAGKQEAGKQEAGIRDAGNRDSAKQDVAKQGLLKHTSRKHKKANVAAHKHETEVALESRAESVDQHDPGAHFNAAASLSGQGEYVKLNSMLSMALEQSVDTEGSEYDADDYLQGVLLKAYRNAQDKNKNILLEFGNGSISIDVKASLVQMGMGSFQLRELASFPLIAEKVNILLLPRRQVVVDVDSGKTITSFDALIWKVALFASRGRAPLGTDLSAPVGLKYWPNFTRLLLSPGALRMAALWASHEFSISQLCKTLKLSRDDVLNFYSAAHAINLVHFTKGKTESALPSSKVTGVKSLLGSILKKLQT